MVRLRDDSKTRDDMARRIQQGKSKREVIRCLIGGVSPSDLHPGRS